MLNQCKTGSSAVLDRIRKHIPGQVGWVSLALMCSLSGCDFLKIKEEAVTAPTTQTTQPAKPAEAPPPAPPPPPPPPKETPEQIATRAINEFKSKPPANRADSDVQKLASLDEGARATITELNLETSQVGAGTTRVLKAFPNLKILNLSMVNTLEAPVMGPILECKTLECLYLDQVRIDEDFLRGLGKLDGIRDLQISRTPVGERAVGNLLKELPNLERLMLVGLQIKGACFQSITSKKLRLLYADHTPIVPQGAKLIARLPLTHLSLVNCKMLGDAGVAALSGLKDLRELNLSDNGDTLSDAAMVPLGRIKTLEVLRIANNNRITDNGLSRLKGLKNLKILVVNGSAITPQGMAALKKFIPDLNKEGM